MKQNKDKSPTNKFPITKISILFCTALFYVLNPIVSFAAKDVRDSMVKIYSVQNKPDYDNPWNMDGPESVNGSGCVISGNRVLTNAHVISDQTFIQIRLYGQSKKYPARVLAVSHEADLALITPVDASLLTGVPSLQIGDLPEAQQEITVYGFPEGGETLSTTTGVISRIEHQIYIHSIQDLLAAQIDAAINRGNSGGPVILENKIVGIAMQLRKESENIGYMVPAPIIKHLLLDLDDGNYDGIPKAGIALQKVENQSLKKMYRLKDDLSGVLIIDIIPGSPASGKLFPDDIILSIDGHSVADDGTVEFRPKERTDFSYYIQQHQIGEAVSMNVFREGREETIELILKHKSDYERNDILTMIQEKRNELGPEVINDESAAMIVARELGVDLHKMSPSARQRIEDITESTKNVAGLVGRVDRIGTVRTFARKDGGEGKVASIFISDETGSIRVALWDEMTKAVSEEHISVGSIIQVRGAYVKPGLGNTIELNLGRMGTIKPLENDEIEELGVDFGQGYGLKKPQPLQATLDRLISIKKLAQW